MTGKVSELKNKKKFEGCCWCGSEKDHEGFFNCPRVKSATMEPDGTYSVEFWEDWHSADADSVS